MSDRNQFLNLTWEDTPVYFFKTLKKNLIMRNVSTLLLLVFGFSGYGQIINFPDPKFKNALINTPCVDTDGNNFGDIDADLNNDGQIAVSEAEMVSALNITDNSIKSLEGIQHFKNLTDLHCGSNQLTDLNLQGLLNLISLHCFANDLTSINLQGLSKLKILACSKNQLTDLNLQGLSSLVDLNCSGNQLTSLDVQGLTNLVWLSCDGNQLTDLNLQGLTSLVGMNCARNQLTSLDVLGLTNLLWLACTGNQLTDLNLQGLTSLFELHLEYNQLTDLNLQGLPDLTYLECGGNQLTNLNLQDLPNLFHLECGVNQLTDLNLQGLSMLKRLWCDSNRLVTLNIKGGNYEEDLIFSNNPDLKYICCDDQLINRVKSLSISNGQNCEVNSYCSFTPGGKFYTIRGNSVYDGNSSGCENQDTRLNNLKYGITDGNISGTIITGQSGNYNIPVQEGTHTITPILLNPDHFIVSPPSFTFTFPSNSDTIIQDFCITPKGVFRQINITVIPLTPPARPGFEASYKIIWENVGNQIENGTLNFTYDESKLDYITATETADQIADGIVSWNLSDLQPFEKREITVTLRVNRPTDTPAVNAGDKLYLSAAISDNVFTLENTVVGSYDPNDKTCLQGDRVKPDMVGEYVDYLIRFENTGNYAAENIVVKDIIDTTRFDVGSLQITYASHEVYARIAGNKVEFIFENIQLPFDDANNDGYIAFKIKTLPALTLGDSLKNLADIYFDYNFPIRTNEAKTAIALPVNTEDAVIDVDIYPNPVKDILYVRTGESWTKAEIYDLSGRIVRSVTFDGMSLDVGDLVAGSYFLRLKNKDRTGRIKFVKM